MRNNGNTWAIVLAAGEGSRLRRLTTTTSGVAIPKQFCSLSGGPSLLQMAINRAESVTSRDFVCPIVATQHRQWWEGPLQSLAPENVIVQPENRGTANGILLPLLHIMARDPHARVVLLPSDHYVHDEAVLRRSLRQSINGVSHYRNELIMLGIQPDYGDPELGYIVPGRCDRRRNFEVSRFVEKPTAEVAHELIRSGALWNAFILVATARSLLRFFERRCPSIVMGMRNFVEGDRSRRSVPADAVDFYAQLPTMDFSHDIIHEQEARLRVLPVPTCGWSDLGTPKRVADALRRAARDDREIAVSLAAPLHLNRAVEQAGMKLTG